MDMNQLEKRVEWLDEERRKDKATITALQKKLAELEGGLDKSAKELKSLGSEVTRSGVQISKIESVEQALEKHRGEVKTEIDAQEKRAKRREQESKKRQDSDLEAMNKSLAGFKDQVDKIAKFRDEVVAVRDAASRLDRELNELETRVNDQAAKETDYANQFRTIQDDQRQDAKRIADVQGEAAALRKRADESRAKLDLAADTMRKLDVRLAELTAAETERREAQSAFIDKVTTQQMDRDRTWKEWNKRFDEVERQSNELAALIQNVGDTERAVKRAQEKFEEITDQINRRINEITEMQRLGEERFRQEWATFRADDQKRWTNYMLTQEELQKETGRQLERLSERSTDLEDNLQELRDVVQHLAEQSQRQLQTLLATLRDWVAESEQFSGTVR
ncbi:MAG: hypothetical protein EPO32_02940 [Anaerolineae bacterium]|nr:MAG: hypothetical protein EPO32_02940 [Anaerolineae bacterium]